MYAGVLSVYDTVSYTGLQTIIVAKHMNYFEQGGKYKLEVSEAKERCTRFRVTNRMAFQTGNVRHYAAGLHASPFFITERWLCVFILLGAF